MNSPRTSLAISRNLYDGDADDIHARVKAMYARTKSVAEFATLNVAYLMGVLPVTPGFWRQPCRETFELAEDLIELNRAGFLTEWSQPFRSQPDAQKPYVTGMVRSQDAHRLIEAFEARAARDFVYHVVEPFGATFTNAAFDANGFHAVGTKGVLHSAASMNDRDMYLEKWCDGNTAPLFARFSYMWVAARDFGRPMFPTRIMVETLQNRVGCPIT